MAFASLIFMTVTNTQQYCVQLHYTEFLQMDAKCVEVWIKVNLHH